MKTLLLTLFLCSFAYSWEWPSFENYEFLCIIPDSWGLPNLSDYVSFSWQLPKISDYIQFDPCKHPIPSPLVHCERQVTNVIPVKSAYYSERQPHGQVSAQDLWRNRFMKVKECESPAYDFKCSIYKNENHWIKCYIQWNSPFIATIFCSQYGCTVSDVFGDKYAQGYCQHIGEQEVAENEIVFI